jgi:hypothetical protein
VIFYSFRTIAHIAFGITARRFSVTERSVSLHMLRDFADLFISSPLIEFRFACHSIPESYIRLSNGNVAYGSPVLSEPVH